MVNGRTVDAMANTGVTHNFVSGTVMPWLGLCVDKHTTSVKVINSKAKSVAEVLQAVTISLGDWDGKINLLSEPLDDFDLILSIDFLAAAKAVMILG